MSPRVLDTHTRNAITFSVDLEPEMVDNRNVKPCISVQIVLRPALRHPGLL
jgi:hypothetical protein